MNPFHNPFHSNLKPRLYNIQSGVVMEENWALPVYQCWLQALQISVLLINLLSILLSCMDFTRVQRKLYWIKLARDHQTVTMTFLWCKVGFGKCFGEPSQSGHCAGCHRLLHTIHFLFQVKIQSRNDSLMTLQNNDFFDFRSIHEAPT